ncbi:MAG TPA: hypothetical protein VI756_04350, partial [Blastocatellia bacterium]
MASNTEKNRLDRLQAETRRFQQRDAALSAISRKYWIARRTILVGGFLIAVLVFALAGQSAGWVVVGVALALFIGVAIYHQKVLTSLDVNRMWLNIKATQIARINLDWKHLPDHTEQPPTPGHPFEFDLDITGEYSLHRLLDSTVTGGGSKRLREWLLSTKPDLDVISKRQAVVRELSGLALFRQKLLLVSALMTRRARASLDAERVLAWIGPSASAAFPVWRLAVLSILSVVNITLFVLFEAAHLYPYWLFTWLAYLMIYWAGRGVTNTAFEQALALEESLKNLQTVFGHLEKYHHTHSPNVAAMAAPFLDPLNKPSAYLKRVSRAASGLSFRRGNPYVWGPVQAIVPMDLWYAYYFNRYRAALATLLPSWVEVWFELDALTSLANFADLNPEYAFPIVRPASHEEEPAFEALGLGHPLIPKHERVANDFKFDRRTRIGIITGSN